MNVDKFIFIATDMQNVVDPYEWIILELNGKKVKLLVPLLLNTLYATHGNKWARTAHCCTIVICGTSCGEIIHNFRSMCTKSLTLSSMCDTLLCALKEIDFTKITFSKEAYLRESIFYRYNLLQISQFKNSTVTLSVTEWETNRLSHFSCSFFYYVHLSKSVLHHTILKKRTL